MGAFFALAIVFAPFTDFEQRPAALITAFMAIAAMAVRNDMQRVHLPGVAPTTFMTGNATHATVGAVGILAGDEPAQARLYRTMFRCTAINLFCFAAGCAVVGRALLGGRLLVPDHAARGDARRPPS